MFNLASRQTKIKKNYQGKNLTHFEKEAKGSSEMAYYSTIPTLIWSCQNKKKKKHPSARYLQKRKTSATELIG